jgi:hypothetical protein
VGCYGADVDSLGEAPVESDGGAGGADEVGVLELGAALVLGAGLVAGGALVLGAALVEGGALVDGAEVVALD